MSQPISSPITSSSSPLSISPVDGIAENRRPSMESFSPIVCHSASTQPSATSALFSPPQLTLPREVRYNERRLIEVLDEIHFSGEELMSSFTKGLNAGSARLRQLSFENMEKLREAAEKTQESGFWSLLQKIGECILAAISAVLGITLVGTAGGTAIGAVLIASGILTLSNFALRETGSWDYIAKKLSHDKEQQKKLATYLPVGMGLLAAVLGLGGSAATALWTTLSLTQKALTITQTTLGIYQGYVTAGKGFSEVKALWIQGELIEIETETTRERICFERDSSSMKSLLKILENTQQTAEQVIDLASQAVRKSAIQV